MNLKTYIQQKDFFDLLKIYKNHKNITYQKISNFHNYDQISKKYGVYLVWVKKQKFNELVYIGCAGKLKSISSVTNQTLKQRIKLGHTPRRFSIKNNFFGINPLKGYKNKVYKIDKEKIKDDKTIYELCYPLSNLLIEFLYFENVFQNFSPKFVERTLLDTFYKNYKTLPIGNTN